MFFSGVYTLLYLLVLLSGSDCDEDYNMCLENPCPEGATCTDYHPFQTADHGKQYECGDCPAGYSLSADKTKCLGKINQI